MTIIDRPAQSRLLHVVSYLAATPFDPRGVRTRRIVDALAPRWQVDLVSGPTSGERGARTVTRRAWDYGLYRLYGSLAMDRYETWSIRRFARWRPQGAGALLIGYPYSPLAYAARALRRRNIPYVVDIGDPWAITAAAVGAQPHSRWRGRRAERAVFQGAAGAILTTDAQAAALSEFFPHLPILVRHNGYDEASAGAMPPRVAPASEDLHLGHFGRLYGPRIDIGGALHRLAASGRWRRVVVHQFGEVERGKLDSVPSEVQVIVDAARPWREVQQAAAGLSAVLVVGNLSASQFPSKVVEYFTLPAPRIALVRDERIDPVATYVRDRISWLVSEVGAPDLPDRVAVHVEHDWSQVELAPPPDEAWPFVAARIADFVSECVDNHVV